MGDDGWWMMDEGWWMGERGGVIPACSLGFSHIDVGQASCLTVWAASCRPSLLPMNLGKKTDVEKRGERCERKAGASSPHSKRCARSFALGVLGARSVWSALRLAGAFSHDPSLQILLQWRVEEFLDFGLLGILRGDEDDTGVDSFFDGFTLEMLDHRHHSLVTHEDRILHDQPLH